MKERKYTQGTPILFVSELFSELAHGRWVWIRHRAYHPAFVLSQSARYLLLCVEQGWVSQAQRGGEDAPKKPNGGSR